MSEVRTPPAPEKPQIQPAPAPPSAQAMRQPPEADPAAADPAADRKRGAQRRGLFLIVAVVVLAAGLIFFLYWLLVLSHYVSTDDAYVGADVAEVTPLVAGAVSDVRVSDTQMVKKGDILAVIDPADAKVAAERAEAGYGSATRRVQQNFSTNDALSAQIVARDADLARAHAQTTAAESDVAKAKVDLERREALASTGAVSGEELTTARNAYQTAVANLSAAKAADALASANRKVAQGQYQAQLALTKGLGVAANPDVQTAKAALDAANLDLERTIIRAPIDGVIARRNVQVGQRVAVGSELMTVVPIGRVYVDANFKEVQLRQVRIGQDVTLVSDKYGGRVVYHGRVAGVGGGTGSAFALIPAQNATGNWIKVVQRLPVRVRLDPGELRQHPLEVGLSMKVKVHLTGGGDPVESSSATTTTTTTSRSGR
jgi:membrane fusion protein (multidrug efflux system)